jgi:RecA DNA recombination protein
MFYPARHCGKKFFWSSINYLQVSRPYKQAEFEIIFGEGVSKLVSIVINWRMFFVLLRHALYLFIFVKNSCFLFFHIQGCILDCAEMFDVVLKKGSWYSYKDQRYITSLCSHGVLKLGFICMHISFCMLFPLSLSGRNGIYHRMTNFGCLLKCEVPKSELWIDNDFFTY